MYFAVTLTASPHKNKFKKLCWSKQQQKYIDFLEKYRNLFIDYQYVFEVCPTSNTVHVHMCVSPIEDHELFFPCDIMDMVFYHHFIHEFGYDNNPKAHFVLIDYIKDLFNYDKWIDYMYKEAMKKNTFLQYIKK